jgi:hypothetical protein
VSPELLQAVVSNSCGDYHYHSVHREKTDSHAEKNSSKTELFTFLADKIVKMCSNNTVIVTQEEGFVCN